MSSPHRGSVNSLQVDLREGRYLLSSASDASVAAYDVQRATEYNGSGLIAKHKHIFLVDKQHEQDHKYAISTAIWYPIDTGLFITGSYDHYVNVWDTNMMQVVINFKMPGKVYKTARSPVATSHMLIAAGNEDVQVRLCDISSGAFAHTLSGHRGSDSRLRLGDIGSGCNTLVNYETSRLQATKAIQLAISHDSTLAFVPCMSTTKAFDLWSGKTMMDLRGHFENVNCCLYNSLDQWTLV